MPTIHESIEVNVPVRTAYDQWTQFEDFPRFMEGVERVIQMNDTTLEWTARIGGQEKTWRATIMTQEPDREIAWQSTSGAKNGGVVRFEPLAPDSTRIDLTLEVEPEGAVEHVGTALHVPQGQVKGDLDRFKQFIEGRGEETGAWRGKIEAGSSTGEMAARRTTGGMGSSGMGNSGMGSSGMGSSGMGNTGPRDTDESGRATR
ncbi:MAG TPA: SRPBCC family protein [Candidatus Limnocylindrales bacterium]